MIETEKVFLAKLREEIDTAHFGEGISFNFSYISDMISKRITHVNKRKPIKKKA